jgi:hypothetical protein
VRIPRGGLRIRCTYSLIYTFSVCACVPPINRNAGILLHTYNVHSEMWEAVVCPDTLINNSYDGVQNK